METILTQLKAASDSNRLRILMMLRHRPLCVCEILEILDIAGGTLSNHLKILKNADLVSMKKEGTWLIYSIKDDTALSLIDSIATFTTDTTQFDTDAARLATVNKLSCGAKSCCGEKR
ncbi:MAG: winged helix-turn-helix transcriptional regulator [Spirochaetales bacterium]|nr:winged helix-turn-helix transcriptional regulator [Spirochaetales bacterium]